jgi:hypothetical protein
MFRFSACLIASLTLAVMAQANEIGYVEEFSLAANRADALKQLIPGSEDYYYYNCLYLQQTGAFDKVDELVKQWIERHGRTGRVEELINRNALLSYEKDANKALDFLRWRLGLNFDHRQEIVGVKPNAPTRLDPAQITRDVFTRDALNHFGNLQGFEDSALEILAQQNLTGEQRRELLGRLKRPDIPNMVKLAIEDLRFQYSSGFGSLEIHKQLLLPQLDECLKLMPELLNQVQFVNIYLTKLQPAAGVDIVHDPKERAAYFDRLWAFAQRLAPAHNSLKAHILYHRLAFDREQGVYDKERFTEYLKLPRATSYIRVEYIEQLRKQTGADHTANLNQDFSSVTLLVPINIDEPLVRDYLMHFFAGENDFQAYAVYIRDDYLKEVFAETKIVNGIGDMEKWYSMLNDPAKYQRLKDRVDIDFAPTNKQLFSADEAVSLDVEVKNVKALIVKVFELNTINYYREKNREIDTSINLDGLVANDEKTYPYDDPPLRRVRRHFEFPALKKPGVFVVEFIGNGTSSRALIHKGHLRFVERIGAAGHIFTVMDEENHARKEASIWLAGHEYTANKEGEISVPFSTNPGRQNIILSDAGFTSFDYFEHKAEIYTLNAGFYVDREALLKRRKATVLIRPRLTLTGMPATVALLEEVALQIRTTDRDGISTTKEVSDFKLFDDKEATYEFQTPDNIIQIAFALKAKVKSLTLQKKLDLAASRAFALNRIDTTDKIESVHLNRTSDGYFIQVLGKTGESVADRPAALDLKHKDFREPAHAQLQTAADGKIGLGELPEIRTLTVRLQDGQSYSWILPQDDHSYLTTVHGKVGEVLHVPYMGSAKQPERTAVSLLEQRSARADGGGTFVRDYFENLAIADGFYEIKGLAAGDYLLTLKDVNEQLVIRVSEGEVRDGFVLGENRLLEITNADPVQIATVDAGADAVKIQLKNSSRTARVHVIADRFEPAYSINVHLSNAATPEPECIVMSRTISNYLTGRNIGDEYRYILDRRVALKFPGNMLARPSLLLNPWTLRTTDTAMDTAAGGGSFGNRTGGGRRLMVKRQGGSVAAENESGPLANLDFLPASSVVLANLAPDKDGIVSIPRKDLGEHQFVRIFAADNQSSVVRDIALPEQPLKPLDLRLATGLDPAKHFTEQKQIGVIPAGQTLTMEDIATSSLESFDTLGKVFSLYTTLSHDPKLGEFTFILDWPKLKAEEKRTKYSKFACHELNFFLFKKDPDFFKTVILPYLKNKKDKTFMDLYLVGDDLASFVQPWQYGRLNVVERILLAQRIQGEQDPAARHVKDLYDLTPPDLERFNFLFKTALQGNALEAAGGAGFREATGKVVEANERKSQQELGQLDGAAGEKLASDTPASGNGFGGGASSAPPPAPSAAPPADGKPAALAKKLEGKMDASKAPGAKKEMADERKESKRKGAPVADEDVGAKAREKVIARDELQNREDSRQFYRKLDKTEELAENNYYKLPIEEQHAELITVNAFWKDYAANWNKAPFLSSNLAEASHNFPEIMCALAVLDLPFEAGAHASEFKAARMTLNAKTPIVAYYKEIKESPAVEKTPVLVSQNFYRADDRYRYDNNERFDKYVTDEFLVHTVYGCQVVLTNPTSSPQKLDLLLQIPRSAMPAANGFYTRGQYLQLQPYSTATFEYYFYFPQPGDFTHYPVHVARNGKMIASAPAVTLKAVNKLTRIDTESWDYISQNGTDEQVVEYMNANNIDRINLDRIAWRMKNAPIFKNIIALLTRRHVYNGTLWSYGIVHNDAAAIREYLTHNDDFVNQSGLWLESKLLNIDPVARNTYQHLEYSPLVNARAHRLGKEHKILNDRFWEQYVRLLNVVKYKSALDDTDRLAVAYYMLLQDRIEEGLAFFKRVDAGKVATRIQYDYVKAYVDFYSDDHKLARDIAVTYKDYPVDRWKNRFADVAAQIDEADGQNVLVADNEDRGQVMGKLAATEPNFEFKIEGKKVQIAKQNLNECQVNYYPMDIELLFSTNPFVHDVNDQFAFVRPVKTEAIKFPDKSRDFEFEAPKEFHNSNVMVEVVAAGMRKSQPYFANALTVQMIETYGQVKVTNPRTGAA